MGNFKLKSGLVPSLTGLALLLFPIFGREPMKEKPLHRIDPMKGENQSTELIQLMEVKTFFLGLPTREVP